MLRDPKMQRALAELLENFDSGAIDSYDVAASLASMFHVHGATEDEVAIAATLELIVRALESSEISAQAAAAGHALIIRVIDGLRAGKAFDPFG